MDGVTIIQTNVYRACNLTTLLIFIIAMVVVCIILAVAFWMLLSSIKTNMGEKVVVALSVLLMIVFCVAGTSDIIKSYKTTYTRYTVDIDNSVGFNEFFSKYRIIEQKDGHYIVEEIKE